MNRIGRFYRVSFDQFVKDWPKDLGNPETAYNNISLPKRATSGSAGYDFFTPVSFTLPPNASILVPTGIRVRIAEGWVLTCYPKSGLGFRYRLMLDNTVGIIDSDYFEAENEGHIFAKLTNASLEELIVTREAGQPFLQGVFLPFGITEDDKAEGKRIGGLGSTEKP